MYSGSGETRQSLHGGWKIGRKITNLSGRFTYKMDYLLKGLLLRELFLTRVIVQNEDL